MVNTVLGKRTRSAVAQSSPSATTSTPTTRSKSKAFVVSSDKPENPFVTPRTRSSARPIEVLDENEDELDDLDKPGPLKKLRSCSAFAKRATPSKRLLFSPSKKQLEIESSSTSDDNPVTPSTPRHRDALSKKVPVTPRHRVGVLNRPLTPQSPRTPTSPRLSGSSVYNDARKAFARSTHSQQLIGREKEREELWQFVKPRLESKVSGSLYVSGPPGTGKSALVMEVCGLIREEVHTKHAYVNCMSVKTAADIYAKLLDEFEQTEVMEGHETAALEALFLQKDASYLVILDEIDHLLGVDLDLMYKLFEWSLKKKSSLLLIGIANALDFTDRFLPRLKTRGLRPHLLPFMPYSAVQIADVISSKLKALLPEGTEAKPDFVPFIHPTAVLFASKKVAAQTGDLRKAFSICLRAIDLIESETRTKLASANSQSNEFESFVSASPTKTPLREMDNVNLTSPPTSRSPKKQATLPFVSNPLKDLTVESAPRATIAHMARVTAAAFSNGSSQRLSALNLQQKAALCALVALEEKHRGSTPSDIPSTPSKSAAANAAPTVKRLFETYAALCTRDNVLHPLSSTEFSDVVSSLEALSLVAWVEGKKGSLVQGPGAGTPSRKGRGRGSGFVGGVGEEKRVASCVGVKEVRDSLEGTGAKGILGGLLDGEGL
ncbi:cell division control protein Cdc6 [Trichodelitschia bisporula]|uniref:Cell division control protein n=1 Tax=Trichodelitschia bisporula TaxID=703511 RepID=A0A6G1IB81_9PEZI|nr:cell division control protein Cdc6 [Trichodelitschia bisporula]